MMRPKGVSTKRGSRWVSQQFRSLVAQTYSNIPTTDVVDWARHFQTINRLADRLGGHEQVVEFAAWWFKVKASKVKYAVLDPSALWSFLPEYIDWLKVNRSLVQRMGVDKTVDYLLGSTPEESE